MVKGLGFPECFDETQGVILLHVSKLILVLIGFKLPTWTVAANPLFINLLKVLSLKFLKSFKVCVAFVATLLIISEVWWFMFRKTSKVGTRFIEELSTFKSLSKLNKL